MGRPRLWNCGICAPVPLVPHVGPPLYRPSIERLATQDAWYRCPELTCSTHTLYDYISVLSVYPVSELVWFNSGPVCLHIHTSKKKSLCTHEIIIRLYSPICITDDVRSHS